MDRKRTSVGLDVNARSVVAYGLDGVTGELFERRLTPDHGELLGWLQGMPGPTSPFTLGMRATTSAASLPPRRP